MTPIQSMLPPTEEPEPGWSQSLATGAPGIALLHLENARSGAASWDSARQWVAAMTRGPVTAKPDAAGLYRGVPAVAFTLHAAGHDGVAASLGTLDRHIATLTRHRLARAHERIDRAELPLLREFDLISGLTGIGAALLHRHGRSDLAEQVLAYLVRLTEPIRHDGDLLPGWWCPTGPRGQSTNPWRGGHGNLGLAHGIAGPLALLATAMRRGTTVPGHADAIERIATWLDSWRCGAGSEVWWPGTISYSEWRTRTVRQPGPQRPSWCYGTPGLARAQQLAALALADTRRQRAAETALARCVRDEGQLALLRDASVCHGWAGLVHTVRRAAADATEDSDLPQALPGLDARLRDHLHRCGQPADPGLLEGHAGIQLVQLAQATNTAPVTRWDACLLLEG
ncbi:lanthionine synthetase C family protein [Amycolatopsis sp. lyj-108]|uniref:lanthionine synthetase C family protein n=1 Tax=Amycolatopsis sp. lyj-108 TaxID=2789286 RepID=UPI00397DB325